MGYGKERLNRDSVEKGRTYREKCQKALLKVVSPMQKLLFRQSEALGFENIDADLSYQQELYQSAV